MKPLVKVVMTVRVVMELRCHPDDAEVMAERTVVDAVERYLGDVSAGCQVVTGPKVLDVTDDGDDHDAKFDAHHEGGR